jgi:NAD(P)-dependent dehydrogenase (short-subunit alcohol dehydrogenase family)
LAAATVEQFGQLDIAFANAGVGSFGQVVDVDPAEFMRVIEVNLLGPLLTVKHAARRMDDGGSIILTASLNAVQPGAGMGAYCCSKSALAMLAQVAAMELGPKRIRVNAIGPGLVRTHLSEPMWTVPGIVEDFDANAPLATTTSADDVASLVTFLASDDAMSISGTLQLVDRAAHTTRYPEMLTHINRALEGSG